MGAFVILIVTMLLAIWFALTPLSNDTAQTSIYGTPPGAMAVAANLLAFHQAAVTFVSQTANKTPTSTRWGFTYSDQKTVRCTPYTGATYTTYVAAGCTGTSTQFPMPSFLSESDPLYDWVVCYQTGAQNIVVTYSRSGESPGGYTPAQIDAALGTFDVEANYSGWYWGVTSSTPALSKPSALTLPTTCTTSPATAVTTGVIALATVIP